MSDPNTYNPRYVELDNIPLSGPGSDPNTGGSTSSTSNVLNSTKVASDTQYSDTEKRKALFYAETRLDADVNDGREIPDSDVGNMHKAAVMNLATHVLTHAAEDPSSVTLGDVTSEGTAINDYSSTYKSTYEEMVDLIEQSDSDGGGGKQHRTYTST